MTAVRPLIAAAILFVTTLPAPLAVAQLDPEWDPLTWQPAPVIETNPPVPRATESGWATRGSREPDTVYDDAYSMFQEPDTRSWGSRIYLNAVAQFGGTSVNPNNGITASQVYPGGSQSWYAYFGVWKDCNADGYVGSSELGLLEYRSELLLDDSICPYSYSSEYWQHHNQAGWVRELLWIGPADSVGDQNLDGRIEDDIAVYAPATFHTENAKVWGDYGLPWESKESCPVSPPRGTTASTGGIVDYTDCHLNRRTVNYYDFAVGEVERELGFETGLRFGDPRSPETSGSLANQDLPVNLYGNPHEGYGQGWYSGGLFEDGNDAGGDDYEPAYQTFDCGDPQYIEAPVTNVVPNDPTGGMLSGPIGSGDNTVTVWRYGGYANDPTEDGVLLVYGAPNTRIDIDHLQSGSYYDATENLYNGSVGGCDERSDDEEAYHALQVESGVPGGPRRSNDIIFTFQGQPTPTPTAITSLLGRSTPADLGLDHLRTSQGLGWVGSTSSLTEPQLFRSDGQPSGAQYVTVYADPGWSIYRGFETPSGGWGRLYGVEACGWSYDVRSGWDCNEENWYRDAWGNDIAPRQAYGPNHGWSAYGNSRVVAARIYDRYHLRDIDCFDGSLVQGAPAYASAQYLTDDRSCEDTQGALRNYWSYAPELDEDFNGVGDVFQATYGLSREQIAQALSQGIGDFDSDLAGLIKEFKWDTVPLFLPGFPNARDYDGDAWLDGPEIDYWNAADEDSLMGEFGVQAEPTGGVAYRDQDSYEDTDVDGIVNQHDPDSDDDGLADGPERDTYHTYPEFADSDCADTTAGCTDPADTKFRDPARIGGPGAGDQWPDAQERAYWIQRFGANGPLAHCDDDAVPNILDPDSDGDGALDGAENAIGDDPCDNGLNDDIGTVAAVDPTNEDLAVLDPTNAYYLANEVVSGTVNGTLEAANEDLLAPLAPILQTFDTLTYLGTGLVTALVTDPITRVLEPVVADPTSVVPTPAELETLTRDVVRGVSSATSTVLATCGLDPLAVDPLAPPAPEQTVTDTTSCLTQVVEDVVPAQPLLDEVIGLATQAPSTVLTTVPTAVGLVNDLVDVPLDDPLAAVEDAVEPVLGTVGVPLPVVDLPLPRATPANLHPKMLADELSLVYDTLMQTLPDDLGAKETAVSTADSLFYNLYVARDGGAASFTAFNVPHALPTLFDLDANDVTGIDGNDVSITASFGPSTGLLQLPPLQANGTTPTIHVEALSDAARRVPLVACAFFQLPGASFVASTCLDTRNATLAEAGLPAASPGFPDAASASFSAYAFGREDPEVAATMRLESQSVTHASLPIVATGSVFEVDLDQRHKPRVADGDSADGTLLSATGQGSVEYHVASEVGAPTGSEAAWTWTANIAGRVTGTYALQRGEREVSASSTSGSLPSSLVVRATRAPGDDVVGITTESAATGAIGYTTAAIEDRLGGSVERFALAAHALPPTLTVQVDAPAGTLSVTSDVGSPRRLQLQSARDRAACPGVAGTDHVTWQPADAVGGACLALRLNAPVESLSVSLASGGPSLSLATSASKQTPLAVLMRPGTGTTRTLDAALSNVPTSLTLQSALAQADGSTTLSWTASDVVYEASIAAKSEGTLLYWAAERAPPSTQATYAWTSDAMTIETNGGNGDARLEFALTNQGSAPTLAGDHLAGRYGSGGSPAISAAARLTAVTDARANLATESFLVETTGGAGQPLGVRYARDGSTAFSLDASRVSSDLSLRSLAQGASHSMDYSGPSGITLSWLGDFPGAAHIEGEMRTTATSVSTDASPSAGTFVLDAASALSSLEIVRSSAGASASTLGGDDVVHLAAGAPGGEGDVYRVSLRDVASLDLAKSVGSLTVLSSSTSTHPLRVMVEDAAYLYATTTAMPASMALTYGRAGIGYEASATPTRPDVTLSADVSGGTIRFEGEGLPTSADLTWGSAAGGVATLQASHSATGQRVPRLYLAADLSEASETTGSEFVHALLVSAPSSVGVVFDGATDEISVTTDGGAADEIEFRHGASTSSLEIPSEPTYALLRRAAEGGTASFEVLRLESASGLQVRLAGQAGQKSQVRIDATSGLPFYVEYDSATGDRVRARLSNVPGYTDVQYGIGANQGGANTTGFDLEQTSGGIVRSLVLHAEAAGQTLTAEAGDIPTSWEAAWAAGFPLDIRASAAALKIGKLGIRPLDEPLPGIPGADAYLYVDADATEGGAVEPRIGASFPHGIRHASSDLAQRSVQFSDLSASHAAFKAIHRDAGESMSLDASDPAASFLVRAAPVETDPETGIPTGTISLRSHAIGATGALTWGVDAAGTRWRWSGTNVPANVLVDLDAANARLVANVPAGAGGEFSLQYTSDPSKPFYGDAPGLVLLRNPASVDYPANVTTFTLDVPYLRSIVADLPAADAAAQEGASYELRRASAAPLDVVLFGMAGAESLRIHAGGVGSLFDSSWGSNAASGLHAEVVTTNEIAPYTAAYRGSEDVADATFGAIRTSLQLTAAPKADAATLTQSRVAVDLVAGGPLGTVDAYLDAAGAIVDLELDDATSDLHVDMPLQGSSTGATASVATTTGSIGRARVLVAPRDDPTVPVADEPQHLVATFGSTAASVRLDLAHLERATWASVPLSSTFDVDLDTSAASADPIRVQVLTGDDAFTLLATSTMVPQDLHVAANAGAENARLAWTSATPGADATASFLASSASIEATLAGAPAAWTLAADSAAPTAFLYQASGRAASIVADAALSSFGAHVDADGVPATIAWDVPATTCPLPTIASISSVSTRGTGAAGRITAWTLPGAPGTFEAPTDGEHAILACDDNGARTSLEMTAFERVAWERIAPATGGLTLGVDLPDLASLVGAASAASGLAPTTANVQPSAPLGGTTVGTGAAGLGGMRNVVERAAGAQSPAAIVTSQTLAGGAALHTRADAPVEDFTTEQLTGTEAFVASATHGGPTPGAIVFFTSDALDETVRFLAPQGLATLTLDGTGDDFLFDYAAQGRADGLIVRTSAAGPRVDVTAYGMPTALRGTLSGRMGEDCTGANAANPLATSFSTLGTGKVSTLVAKINDDGAPRQVGNVGMILECQGTTRKLTASGPNVETFGASGVACGEQRIFFPVSHLAPTRLRMDAGAFVTEVNAQARSETTAVEVVLGGDTVTVRSHPTPGAVMSAFDVDHQRVGEQTGLPAADCISFGGGAVRLFSLTAPDLVADLTVALGEGANGGPKMHARGGGARRLEVNVEMDPPSAAPSNDEPGDVPLRIDASVAFPIAEDLLVKFAQTGTTPSAPALGADSHYVVLDASGGGPAGSLKLHGFEGASFTVNDRTVQGESIMEATASLGFTGPARPATILVQGAGDMRLEVKTPSLPRLERIHLRYVEGVAYDGMEATLQLDASAPLDLEVMQHQTGVQGLYASLRAPSDITELSFGMADNSDLDQVFSVASSASGPSYLWLNRLDNAGAQMTVEVNAIPASVPRGTVALTSCGINADLVTGSPIESLLFRIQPGASGDSAANPTTPGCPAAEASSEGSESTTTSILVDIQGIPAGRLKADVRTGKSAGEVLLGPLSAPIRSIHVKTATTGGESGSVELTATNVDMRTAQWDTDGVTSYPGAPRAVYLHGSAGNLILRVEGEKPVYIDTLGPVDFRSFQFRLPFNGNALELQAAGCLTLIDHDDMTVKFPTAPITNAATQVYLFLKNTNPFTPDAKWGWQC